MMMKSRLQGLRRGDRFLRTDHHHQGHRHSHHQIRRLPWADRCTFLRELAKDSCSMVPTTTTNQPTNPGDRAALTNSTARPPFPGNIIPTTQRRLAPLKLMITLGAFVGGPIRRDRLFFSATTWNSWPLPRKAFPQANHDPVQYFHLTGSPERGVMFLGPLR